MNPAQYSKALNNISAVVTMMYALGTPKRSNSNPRCNSSETWGESTTCWWIVPTLLVNHPVIPGLYYILSLTNLPTKAAPHHSAHSSVLYHFVSFWLSDASSKKKFTEILYGSFWSLSRVLKHLHPSKNYQKLNTQKSDIGFALRPSDASFRSRPRGRRRPGARRDRPLRNKRWWRKATRHPAGPGRKAGWKGRWVVVVETS